MGLLHSKHQKLILQCYPPGKAVDKKPNPSELSYLLYYASTRRVKLEKVITFIHQRTTSDVNRTRAGNLQVTLSIVSSLIEKCSENLNVFANQVCTILLLILKIKDVSLSKSVVKTYGVLCSHLDGGLFSGDKSFIDSFTNLSNTLINIGEEGKKSSPNALDWKLISVFACSHVSSCMGYNAKIAKYFTSLCIPLCIEIIKGGNDEKELKGKISNHEGELSKVTSAHESSANAASAATATGSITPNTAIDLLDLDANSSLAPKDIEDIAFFALKSFFDTNSLSQISESTKAVVKHCYELRDNVWGSILLQICTIWVPVQLRFVLLSTLLNKLSTVSEKADAETPNYKFQIQFSSYVFGLLSSDVNMIGLSVSDVIQQLLSLQEKVILHQSKFLDEEQVKSLTSIYSDCICNLSTHVYYFDQVPDSIQEILIKIDSVLARVFSSSSTPTPRSNTINSQIAEFNSSKKISLSERENGHGSVNHSPKLNTNGIQTPSRSVQNIDGRKLERLVITLLTDIWKTLNTLKTKPSSITRNHVLLEHWEVSLSLLTPESSFEGFDTSVLKPEYVSNIQVEYLRIFRNFLTHEFTENEDDDITYQEGKLNEVKTFLKPDTRNYLSNSDNFLTHLFAHFDKLLHKRSTPENLELVQLILNILRDLANLLGINFFANFIPFFFHWIVSNNSTPTDSSTTSSNTNLNGSNIGNGHRRSAGLEDPNKKISDTIAYSIMHLILRVIDEKYATSIEDQHYCIDSTFFKSIESDISSRRSRGLWATELDDTPLLTISSANESTGGTTFDVSRKAIQSFISNNSWISEWVNPNSILLLETNRRQQSSNTVLNNSNANGAANNTLHTIKSHVSDHSEHSNGNYNLSSDDEGSAYNLTVPNIHHNGNSGLGLGTAGDITSIHSEIILNSHNHNHNILSSQVSRHGFNNFNGGTDGSLVSDSRHFLTPKVADLKDVMSRREIFTAPQITFNAAYAHEPPSAKSVLSKQLVQTDMDSILNGLDSDTEIIV